MTQTIQETFAEARAHLKRYGFPPLEAPTATIDQLRAGFCNDLASVYLDPSEERVIYASLAGMAVAMKMMILNGVSLQFVDHYVQLCQCLLPLLESSGTDLTTLADGDFLASLGDAFTQEPEPVHYACSRCGGPNGIVEAGNLHLCAGCASDIVNGGMAAMRLSGQGLPAVGGPEFNREAESAHTEGSVSPQAESTGHVEAPSTSIKGAETPAGGTVDTPPSQSWERQRLAARPWQDLTVNEALRRLFGRRK